MQVKYYWLKSSLKLLNYSVGVGGIVIIMYGVLMIQAWQPNDEDHSFSHRFTFPWFIHAFLVIGIVLCAITNLGHIAANTANIYCLSSYIIVVLLLLILEIAISAYVFLNPEWEKDLPPEKFQDFKDFVKSNVEIFKWVACFIFLIQGVCVLLATIIRTQETDEDQNYESDDEYLQRRTRFMDESPRWLLGDPNIGVCVLLATILRTQETDEDQNYESDDEYLQRRTRFMDRSSRWLLGDPNIV